MGNYIDNDSTKKNALYIIGVYMVSDIYKRWWNLEDQQLALSFCKEAFRRVLKCSDAPLNIVEKMLDELELYEERCGNESRNMYSIGTGVMSDILHRMS